MSVVNARGCLDDTELAAISRAAPGQVPAELATHLATCASCQRRLLAVDLPERSGRKITPPASLQQRMLRVLLVLAAVAVVILSMYRLLR
jgi:hypothetical protein